MVEHFWQRSLHCAHLLLSSGQMNWEESILNTIQCSWIPLLRKKR